MDNHTDGAYAVLRLTGACPTDSQALALGYRLLFDIDQLHRGLLRLEVDGVSHTSVLGPDTGVLNVKAGETSRLAQFGQYLVEGAFHIWIGFDHVLFLLSLLLPAVLVHESRRWTGVGSLRTALTGVLLGGHRLYGRAFDHAVDRGAADRQLPSRLVESAIAASVALAAANNLWPVVERRRWLVAFSFGLIHGFGFASVLTELGLPKDALVLSLLGFNVGVEIGQLVIVACFLPAAYLLRNSPFYRKGVLVGGSILTLLVALVWLAERMFNLKLIGA